MKTSSNWWTLNGIWLWRTSQAKLHDSTFVFNPVVTIIPSFIKNAVMANVWYFQCRITSFMAAMVEWPDSLKLTQQTKVVELCNIKDTKINMKLLQARRIMVSM